MRPGEFRVGSGGLQGLGGQFQGVLTSLPTAASRRSRPLVTPQGKTPISGRRTSCLANASPTSFITPESLPAVMIHAFTEVAAETRPRSNADCVRRGLGRLAITEQKGGRQRQS
jgi:hypothetical protein